MSGGCHAVALVGVAAILAASGLHAQGCSHTPDDAEDERTFATYFRNEASTREVVRDPTICQAVLNAGNARLRLSEPTWPRIEAAGIDFAVYRYGPYYAVLLDYAIDPDTGRPPHYVPLVVFRADDMTFVTLILV